MMMISCVFFAAIAMVITCAASEFALQPQTPFTVVTDAATPKACFESTKVDIPFSYDTSDETSDDGTTVTPGEPAQSCGNTAGRVNDVFSDRVWAVKRGGTVDTGDCLDLWSGAAQKPATWTSQNLYLETIADSLRANQANDVLNAPYRLIITRQLWACKYDSNVDNPRRNTRAAPRVALRREEWKIYHIDFDSTTLDPLISNSFSLSAGATSSFAWRVPSTSGETKSFYKPFADGQTFCQEQSTETCKPGSTSNCADADKIESYGCASSAQLLARAKQTNYSPTDEFKTFPGLTKDFFGDAVDGKSGLVADLWARVSTRIAAFKGKRISTSTPNAEIVSGRYLDVIQGSPIEVVLSNFQESTGFYTGSNFNANIGLIGSKPAVFGSAGSVLLSNEQLEFDPATSSITVSIDDDLPQSHYWATLESDFSLRANWTCMSVGTTEAAPTSEQVVDSSAEGTYGRFRYNCDETFLTATTTPGVPYNDPDATYPASQRLYRGFNEEEPFTPLNNVVTVDSLKADPVYIGFLRSLAITESYDMASVEEAVNGSPRLSQSQGIGTLFVDGASKQSDAWFMTGVATVLISVFFPLSWCFGNAILGKAGMGGGGKSLDVNFSGTKNQA